MASGSTFQQEEIHIKSLISSRDLMVGETPGCVLRGPQTNHNCPVYTLRLAEARSSGTAPRHVWKRRPFLGVSDRAPKGDDGEAILALWNVLILLMSIDKKPRAM